MENEAIGTFDVKLAPSGSGDSPIGSMSIDKTFHGDLQVLASARCLRFAAASKALPVTSRWNA